jgi:hypothetical protein
VEAHLQNPQEHLQAEVRQMHHFQLEHPESYQSQLAVLARILASEAMSNLAVAATWELPA